MGHKGNPQKQNNKTLYRQAGCRKLKKSLYFLKRKLKFECFQMIINTFVILLRRELIYV